MRPFCNVFVPVDTTWSWLREVQKRTTWISWDFQGKSIRFNDWITSIFCPIQGWLTFLSVPRGKVDELLMVMSSCLSFKCFFTNDLHQSLVAWQLWIKWLFGLRQAEIEQLAYCRGALSPQFGKFAQWSRPSVFRLLPPFRPSFGRIQRRKPNLLLDLNLNIPNGRVQKFPTFLSTQLHLWSWWFSWSQMFLRTCPRDGLWHCEVLLALATEVWELYPTLSSHVVNYSLQRKVRRMSTKSAVFFSFVLLTQLVRRNLSQAKLWVVPLRGSAAQRELPWLEDLDHFGPRKRHFFSENRLTGQTSGCHWIWGISFVFFCHCWRKLSIFEEAKKRS